MEVDNKCAKRKASQNFNSVSSIDDDAVENLVLPEEKEFNGMVNSKSFQEEIFDLQVKYEELEDEIKQKNVISLSS